MKEAVLWEPMPHQRYRCNVCQIRCVMKEGQRGFCNTRLVRDAKVYTLIYGMTSSVCIDPIEKKPFYHFYPGTTILSMGTRGCNFKCPGCQNWEISHDRPDEMGENLEAVSPAQSVALAARYGADGICWTYNDPSIWIEHTLEAARIAHEKGLYTAYITNGYSTEEHLDMIAPYLDAYKVDIKAFSREAYKGIAGFGVRLEGILEVTRRAKQHWKLHVEMVTNITPTINDRPEDLRHTARWIRDELGPHTPWHLTRFYPYLELSHLPPTPLETLEMAYRIAKEEGLSYPYVGNVPGHRWEDTYCHKCGKTLIARRGFAIVDAHLKDGKCGFCGAEIPGRWGATIRQTEGRRMPVPV